MPSAPKRAALARRPPGCAARYNPEPIPIGTPIRLARPISSSVPTIALTIPPPFSPTGAGIWVKNARLRLEAPLAERDARIMDSGISVLSGHGKVTTIIRSVFALRHLD